MACAGEDAAPVHPSDPLRFRIYGGVQAFLAVKTDIGPLVLADGYICKRRKKVPCSFEPILAVSGVRKYEKDEHQTVLEVFGLPEDQIHRGDDGATGHIETSHLKAEHLRYSTVLQRCVSDYIGTPCPLCDSVIDDLAGERGKVGNHQFVNGAFMVVPCPNPACEDLQMKRQERLTAGPHLWLYHITDRGSADKIKASGGKMIRGASGNAGGGIYFGLSAADCVGKALHKGVILKCRVKIGEVEDDDECTKWDFAKLAQKDKDSVWGKIGYGTKSYIIYSWDQVQVAAEVDEADKIIE